MLRTATVVFTDLVGSTDLRVALGDDRADAMTKTCQAAVAGALAECGGEVVKSLGDGVMVVFDAASAAVTGAESAQRAFSRAARQWPDSTLAMRVGVATGDAEEEGTDWHGTPVVEASRLCAAADGGQILASALVRSLAGSRGDHRFESIGTLDLKGLGDVEAVAVLWEPLSTPATAPLPAPLHRAASTMLVDRSEERAGLEAQLQRAHQGDRQTALVIGEPGAGKTRLTAEVCVHAAESGWTVLYGRCHDDGGFPYEPFVEAIDRVLPDLDGDVLAEHVDRYGGELGRLLPQLARRIEDLPAPLAAEPEMARHRLFDATCGLLRNLATRAPTLLVVDDLHWASEPTLRLLQRVVVDPEPARLMIIATLRDTDVERTDLLAMLIADFVRLPGVDQVRLQGLRSEDVVTLVTARGRRTQDAESLAELLHRRTAGNPLFIEHLLEYFHEEAPRSDGADAPTLDLTEAPSIPYTVRSLVQQRLYRLDDRTREAMRAGAVAGDTFSVGLLERVVDQDLDALIDRLDRGVDAGLLEEIDEQPGWYGFKHAIVRDAMWAGLSESRRAQLHHGFAKAFDSIELGGALEPTGRALHARQAIPAGGDVATAVELSLAAARFALDRLAPEEAMRELDAAEAVLARSSEPDARHRFALEALRVDAAAELLDPNRSQQHLVRAFDIALDAGQPEWTAEVDVHYARAGVADPDPELIDKVQAVVGSSSRDSKARVQGMAMLAYQRMFRSMDPGAEQLAAHAATIAARLDDAELLSGARLVHGLSIRDPARTRERLAEFRGALDGASVADPRLRRAAQHRMAASRWVGLTELAMGDRRWLDGHVAELEDMAAQLGSPLHGAHARQLNAMLALLDGRFEDAEQLAGRVLEVAAEDPDYTTGYAGQIQAVRREQGRSAEMLPIIEAFAATNPELSFPRAAVALAMTECDRVDEAKATLDDYTTQGFGGLLRDFSWPIVPVLLAEVAAVVGNAVAAKELRPLIEPYRGRLQFVAESGVFCFGAVDRTLGQLALAEGRLDDAVEMFDHAIVFETALDARPLVARSQRWLVQALTSRCEAGDLSRAGEVAEKALATATELGMAHLVDVLGQTAQR